MNEHPRYRVVSKIASGEFATVYKGIDQELGREVAIKQIHPQYLSDPAELERFWREAQLLARLEHPYVMTLYDLVKDRGWLILELARGSLQQQLAGRSIDIEDLRLTLIYMCQALQFLQQNGIVHGDVKPSNLLLDRNHRVKLGDFGIARRLSHDDGSVIKGTTKYMAPEVISDQFGPVGPHSDLYSLGFAAYELLCGEHFESLFPGLNMFGRDPQVAWMMWHTSVDRRLPEVGRVLEGVPEDLAKVIQRLVEKDPKKRYRDASEVLFDLKARHEGKDPDAMRAADEQLRLEQVQKTKRRRTYALIAIGISMVATMGLALIPTGPPAKPPAVAELPESSVIESIDVSRGEMVLLATVPPAAAPHNAATSSGAAANSAVSNAAEPIVANGVNGNPSPASAATGSANHAGVAAAVATPRRVALKLNEADELTLNGNKVELSELQPGDLLTIKDGSTFRMLKVTRPDVITSVGTLARVDRSNGRVDLTDAQGNTLSIEVPATLIPTLNGRGTLRNKMVRLDDLQPGDQATVAWRMQTDRRVAVSVAGRRDAESAGEVTRIELDSRTVWVKLSSEKEAVPFQLAATAKLTLNGADVLPSGQAIGLNDIRTGDLVTVQHNDQVQQLEIGRQLSSSGVVQEINSQRTLLTVALSDPPVVVSFQLSDSVEFVQPTGEEESIERSADFIRRGDRVTVRHASVDLVDPVAEVVEVTPVSAEDRWGIVIIASTSADPEVSALPHALADQQLITEALGTWYRIGPEHLTVLEAPTKLEVLEAIESLAPKVRSNDQLVVYYVGHGYADERAEPWIATTEFELKRMSETGLSLRELLRRLEALSTRETLLLLETGHDGGGEDRRREPATAQWVEVLRRSEAHPVSTVVEIFAGTSGTERAVRLGADQGSLFTKALAEAFSGKGDQNQDDSIDASELASFLPRSVASLSTEYRVAQQTPIRFVPDAKPPRLDPAAPLAVMELLSRSEATRFEETYAALYDAASRACGDQPDADLAWALVNLKHNRTAEARRLLERVTGRWPNEPTGRLAIAWQYAVARRYSDALPHLEAAAANLPVGPDRQSDQDLAWALSAAELIGRLRAFGESNATEVGWDLERLTALDAVAGNWPENVAAAYETGRSAASDEYQRLLEERDAAEGSAQQRLTQQLIRVGAYGDLELVNWREYLRFHLND